MGVFRVPSFLRRHREALADRRTRLEAIDRQIAEMAASGSRAAAVQEA